MINDKIKRYELLIEGMVKGLELKQELLQIDEAIRNNITLSEFKDEEFDLEVAVTAFENYKNKHIYKEVDGDEEKVNDKSDSMHRILDYGDPGESSKLIFGANEDLSVFLMRYWLIDIFREYASEVGDVLN